MNKMNKEIYSIFEEYWCKTKSIKLFGRWGGGFLVLSLACFLYFFRFTLFSDSVKDTCTLVVILAVNLISLVSFLIANLFRMINSMELMEMNEAVHESWKQLRCLRWSKVAKAYYECKAEYLRKVLDDNHLLASDLIKYVNVHDEVRRTHGFPGLDDFYEMLWRFIYSEDAKNRIIALFLGLVSLLSVLVITNGDKALLENSLMQIIGYYESFITLGLILIILVFMSVSSGLFMVSLFKDMVVQFMPTQKNIISNLLNDIIQFERLEYVIER